MYRIKYLIIWVIIIIIHLCFHGFPKITKGGNLNKVFSPYSMLLLHIGFVNRKEHYQDRSLNIFSHTPKSAVKPGWWPLETMVFFIHYHVCASAKTWKYFSRLGSFAKFPTLFFPTGINIYKENKVCGSNKPERVDILFCNMTYIHIFELWRHDILVFIHYSLSPLYLSVVKSVFKSFT